MAKASLVKQVSAVTENKVGMLAQVSSCISQAGVDIQTICAYGMQDKAQFLIIASDSQKAMKALKSQGVEAKEEEVVLVSLPDRQGELAKVSEKIKKAGVDIDYIYGTTCGCKDSESRAVLKTKDNSKCVSAINA